METEFAALNRILDKVKSSISSQQKQSNLQKKSEEGQQQKLFSCPLCNDLGYIITQQQKMQPLMKPCVCVERDKTNRMWRNSGINAEDLDKSFANFEVWSDISRKMKDTSTNYYLRFEKIRAERVNSILLCGNPGCVDKDTEYFNGHKWVKISEYEKSDKVLQFQEDGTTKLVYPQRYIKEKCDTLYEITTNRGSVNQCLSDDHNFAYVTSKGNLQKKRFSEVIEMHKQSKQGFTGKVMAGFIYNGEGIELSENQIRLMVAVIADGCFKSATNRCVINVKKQRKKDRIEALLKATNSDYRKSVKNNGFTSYAFYPPRREKIYTEYWYNCSQSQLRVIANEVLKWDGYVCGKRRTFSTTSKESADFIQFVFSGIGERATISEMDRRNELHKSIEYSVCISASVKVGISGSREGKAKIEPIKTVDGYKYCFTVESGYLVLRRGRRIFVTGNCGKTHMALALANNLLKKNIQVVYMPYRDIITKLKQNMLDEEFYRKTISKYQAVEVLLIDDLFKGKVNETDINIMFEIVNHRYLNRLPIIASTEYTIDKLLTFDEAIGSRIYEMAKSYLVEIEGTENNYRLR